MAARRPMDERRPAAAVMRKSCTTPGRGVPAGAIAAGWPGRLAGYANRQFARRAVAGTIRPEQPEDCVMPDVPAASLCALLARLLQASGPEPAAQRAAIAGFQQLHAQLRHWNDGLLSVLRDYPGFTQSGAPADYDRFLDRLAACREALGEADDSSDPQARLLQDARNTTDFHLHLHGQAVFRSPPRLGHAAARTPPAASRALRAAPVPCAPPVAARGRPAGARRPRNPAECRPPASRPRPAAG